MKAIAPVPANYDVKVEDDTGSVDISARQSLRRALDLNAWLDSRRAAEIALGVVKGLYQLHRRGAPHVKLQPDSVFLSDNGDVIINDDLAENAPRTRAQYMSPEEMQGKTPDARSHFYVLGVVLYEMLTDRVPFDGKDAQIIKQKHLSRVAEPPQVFRSDVPNALSELVMRLLEKDPAQRPQRAADLFSELQNIINAAPSNVPNKSGFIAAAGGNLDTADHNLIIVNADSASRSLNSGHIDRVDYDLFGLESSYASIPELPVNDSRAPGEVPDKPMATLTVRPNTEDPTPSPDRSLATIKCDSIAPSPATVTRPHTLDPTALLSSQLGLGAEIKSDDLPAKSGNKGVWWLALLLMILIAASAFLLYKIGKPARVASNELAAPAAPSHIDVPAPPTLGDSSFTPEAAPSTRPPVKALSPTLPADPPKRSAEPKASRPTRPASAKTINTQAKRRVTRSYWAPPARRAKRRWIRRVLHF